MTIGKILRRIVEVILRWIRRAIDLLLRLFGWSAFKTGTQPTSLILVRRNSAGDVVIRYVRGEQLHPEGTYVWLDQPVALPHQAGADSNQISAPSAISFPTTDRLYVARAIIDQAANWTEIHIVDSGYATMLSESQPQLVLQRPVLIDSAVVLSYIGGELLLVWKEEQVLEAVRSADGQAWSIVEDIYTLPGDGPFALWSEGGTVSLAFTVDNGTAVHVATTTDGHTFAPISMIAANLAGPIRDLSIATDASSVFVAICNAKSVNILRAPKNGTFDTSVEVYTAPLDVPDYQIHAVTVQPSPYGWALQFVASHPTSNGVQFTIFGRRSDDGLDYSGTGWTYGSSAQFLGPTSMTTAPTPMPWIWKAHDSGKDTDAAYNFVITGDGFTYDEKDQFWQAAKTMVDNITNRAPFYYNKDLFNVWVVNTFSKDSGFDSSDTIDDKDTIFEAYRGAGTSVVARHDPIWHARRVIMGDLEQFPRPMNFYGFALLNPPTDEIVAILPWDTLGVPMPDDRANSLVPIHEFLHTHGGAGGFALGDHDRHNQPSNSINKSFDGTLIATGNHAWQHWFVFSGPAASRLVELSPSYRDGLVTWIAAGNDQYSYYRSHFPYSEAPTSPYYVSALSLFNVGLWESELSDVSDLNADRQFTALRACGMNSLLYHAPLFCPICSEVIVKHLQTAAGIVDENAGQPFDIAAFQTAPGAFLEFQLKNRKVCDDIDFPPPINLENLIAINGQTVPTTAISVYESEHSTLNLVGRLDIGPWVAPGLMATVVFHERPATDGETRLWLAGLQIVNGKGARYPMQPVGQPLIDRLNQKHAPECDYEYWDLVEGDLTLTFTPNTVP